MARDTSTQQFVPIRDVKNGVLLLNNGQMCAVLLASSINFALKSLEEQQAILRQFQNFLNTIDFSLQIHVESRRLNIQPYLQLLEGQKDKQFNDLMRIQLEEYIQFVKTFTKEVDIMSKNFFVVVPYTPAPVDVKQGFVNMFGRDTSNLPGDSEFSEHRQQLFQRVTVVEQGLNRVGVKTARLEDEALVELFYHLYNPDEVNTSAPEHG